MRRTLLVLLILVVLSHIVFAQSLESYKLDFNIIQNKVLVDYELIFAEADETSLFLELPYDARTISVIRDGEKLEPTVKEEAGSKKVEIRITENTKRIKLSYISDRFIEKIKKNYFLAELKTPYDTKEFQVKLALPEGSVLDKPVGAVVSSVYPAPSSIETDGQRMIITWIKKNVEKGEGISLLVIYREQEEKILYFLGSFVILIIVVIVLFYIKKKKGRKIIIKGLIETENIVVDELKKAKKNELWQKQLQIKTGLSKVKLSRLLNSLEKRGVIEKERFGNTNKVRLVKNSEVSG